MDHRNGEEDMHLLRDTEAAGTAAESGIIMKQGVGERESGQVNEDWGRGSRRRRRVRGSGDQRSSSMIVWLLQE